MAGWSKDQYEAKQAERARKRGESRKKPLWWFGLADPVARFTAYLAVFTFLLLVVAALQWRELVGSGKEFEAVQRAFVSIDMKSIGLKLYKEGDWAVHPVWLNNGPTQTVELKVETHCIINEFSLDEPSDAVLSRRTIAADRILAPKSSTDGVECIFPKGAIIAFIEGRKSGTIWMRAKYKDVFNKNHVTEVCVRIVDLSGNINGPNLIYSPRPCVTHNCADSQCDPEKYN